MVHNYILEQDGTVLRVCQSQDELRDAYMEHLISLAQQLITENDKSYPWSLPRSPNFFYDSNVDLFTGEEVEVDRHTACGLRNLHRDTVVLYNPLQRVVKLLSFMVNFMNHVEKIKSKESCADGAIISWDVHGVRLMNTSTLRNPLCCAPVPEGLLVPRTGSDFSDFCGPYLLWRHAYMAVENAIRFRPHISERFLEANPSLLRPGELVDCSGYRGTNMWTKCPDGKLVRLQCVNGDQAELPAWILMFYGHSPEESIWRICKMYPNAQDDFVLDEQGRTLLDYRGYDGKFPTLRHCILRHNPEDTQYDSTYHVWHPFRDPKTPKLERPLPDDSRLQS